MKKAPLLGVILAASLGATFGSSLAYAQGEPGGPGPDGPGFMQARFAELDTNGDGRITRDEAEAKAAADFAAADTDGNGTLSEDEARAFHEARHQERRAEWQARHEDARDAGTDRGSRRFAEQAGDDGVIDEAEFATGGLHRFEMADLDENGVVTETEMQIVARTMGGRHHGHHGDHHRWGHGPDSDGPDGDDD